MSEGLFLPPDLKLSSHALDRLIAANGPLLNLPWSIKENLAAVDEDVVHETRVLCPATLCQMLQGGLLSKSTVSSSEALELLEFCLSDLHSDEAQIPPPSTSLSSPPASASASVFDQISGIINNEGWMGLAANATRWRPPPGILDPFLGPQQPRSSSRFDIGTSDMASAARLVLGHASGPPPAAPTATAAQSSAHDSFIKACLGLPIPLLSGEVAVIGSRRIFFLPLECGREAPSLLPPTASILHPDAVKILDHKLRDPRIRQGLSLPLLSLSLLSEHLVSMLPINWHRPDLRSTPLSSTHPLSVPWDIESDQSPCPVWLLRLWRLVNGLLGSGVDIWTKQESEESHISNLDSLPLIPIIGSRLAWVGHRDAIVVGPQCSAPETIDGLITDVMVMVSN